MKKAFTLTELIVCIGIIALLTAILLPALIQARRESQKTTCQSNLKQIHLALRLYIDDNDGTWPSPDLWDERGFSQAKLPGCPQASEPNRDVDVNRLGVKGYAYATGLITDGQNKEGRTVSVGVLDRDIPYPSVQVAVCDAAIGDSKVMGPNPYQFLEGHVPPDGIEKGWLRHNGGGNYLFCDGHIKWYLPDAVGYNILGTNDGSKPTFAF